MRRSLAVPVAVVLALTAAPVSAQPGRVDLPPDAPVRYDTDLLPPSFHADRRARVREALPAGAVAVVFSAPERQRLNDSDFEYRQDGDLYYLTGTHEPESVLILAREPFTLDGRAVSEVLLVPPRDAYTEVWVGRRFGPERAQRELGVEAAVVNARFAEVLRTATAGRTVYLPTLPLHPTKGLAAQLDTLRARVPMLPEEGNGYVRNAVRAALNVRDAAAFGSLRQAIGTRLAAGDFRDARLQGAVRAFQGAADYAAWDAWRTANLGSLANTALLPGVLGQMRMVKTADEMRLLRKAIDASVEGHREAMRVAAAGMREADVEAVAEYVFVRNGAETVGYPSIVGAGENATILHYNTNRRLLQPGELVLMDMGAEVRGYTADVTRTVPVDGRFTAEQKAIYDLVLRAQQAGIDAARAGAPFTAPGAAATRVIQQGLRDLGLIKTEADVRRFFMHGTSHHIGLFVHDVGQGPLVPGAVVTVEPGIYIRPSEDVDPKWWNIGVRIEDDILVTDGDPVNLSAGAPRTTEAIEAIMREAPKYTR